MKTLPNHRVVLLTLALLPLAATAADYRIDCAGPQGRSLARANALELKPGDRLLLRAGCRWTGTLQPKGSGTEAAPIVLGRYGEGAAPIVDGAGAESALLLRNQEFWEIADLEITNDALEPGLRRGVLVRAENAGRALHHIYLRRLDIHNVKGKLGADMSSKCTGGIGFEVITKDKPGRFDDILIADNHIHTVDNMAIYINTDVGPHPRGPRWAELHHTRVVVSGNTLEDIGKNALGIRASLAPLIERNVVRNAAARLHGNAIFVFGSKNAVMQDNEVSGTRWGGLEGAAFDSDYNSEGTIIQYNYSHENGGGLVDLCNNPAVKAPRGFNDGTVVRYNVSRNEGSRIIGFDGNVTNTLIYNNTLYNGPGFAPHIIEFDLFGKTPGYADRTVMRDNIVVNEGEGTYLYGQATNYSFEGNCFAGRHPANEPDDPKKIVGDPQFQSAGSGLSGAAGSGLSGAVRGGVGGAAGGGVSRAAGGVAGGGGATGLASAAAYELKPGSPCGAAGAFPISGYELVEGLVWAQPHGIDLKADLYLPKGAGPFPAVVYLHGGGWVDGDRKQLRRQAAYFAGRGIAGFAVEYRLSGQAPYPAALYDAKMAVRWLRAHAAQYRVDPRRIAAAGSSAGGHLAALLAVTRGDAKLEGDGCCREFSSDVVAVTALNPVLDLKDLPEASSSVMKFLGGRCADRIALCREASPIDHVSPAAAPILILHGTADQSVPYRQAEAMVARLTAAGVQVELFKAPGAAHTFWSTREWYEPSLHAMEHFLLHYLLPGVP